MYYNVIIEARAFIVNMLFSDVSYADGMHWHISCNF